jgi:2-dehydropantoate 2-reductase
VVAAKLTGAVARVAVLDANEEHVARLRDPGLVYEERGAEHTVRLDAVTRAEELDGRFDLALIGVKAPLHEVALEPLVERDAAAAYCSLGNGLIQDRLAALVGRDRLLACLVEWGGTNLGPGRVVRDTVAPMVVGELDGEIRERTRLLARCLEWVGEARITDNVRGMIWSKLLLNTAFTGLSAVSGLRYGGVAAHPSGRRAAVGIWAEGLAVGAAEGLTLEPVLGVAPAEVTEESDGVERLMALSAGVKPSMLQDLEAGRATEVDVVNGGVAARGRAHGMPTPRNDRVVELVHAMERGERRPSPDCLEEVAAAATG